MRVAMIEWWCSSVLHLSLEKYHNAGIPPSRTKEIIQGERDFVGYLNLWCEPSGINNNWNVHTRANNVEMQRDLVIHLTDLMEAELKRMKADVEKQSIQCDPGSDQCKESESCSKAGQSELHCSEGGS